MKSISQNKQILISLFIIGTCFYLLNLLTPEYLDDYLYKFQFINGIANTNHPIIHIKDIINSQINHYFTFNGRIIVHSFVQLFTSILGKNIFNIVNSLCYCLFIFLLIKISINKITQLPIFLINLIIIFLMPAFNDCFLWMTGSINYMWSALCVTLLLYIINKYKETTITFSTWVYTTPIIFIGWMHEGITFPLSVALICYSIIHIKTIYNKKIFPIIIYFTIGALFCTFSPATLARGEFNDEISISTFISKIINGVLLILKLKIIYILIITIIIVVLKQKLSIKTFVNKYFIELISICCAFGITLLSGFSSTRSAFGLELFCLILLLKIIIPFQPQKEKYYTTLTIFIQLIFFSYLLIYSIKNHTEYNNLLTQISSTQNGIIKTSEVNIPNILNKFIVRPIQSEKSSYYENYSFQCWENHYIAATYKKDSLAFFPKTFIDKINNQNNAFTTFEIPTQLPFYVQKIDNNKKIKSIFFVLNKTDFNSIPIYFRYFASKMERYTTQKIQTNKFIIQKIPEKYLFIQKNQIIDSRIKDIKIYYE